MRAAMENVIDDLNDGYSGAGMRDDLDTLLPAAIKTEANGQLERRSRALSCAADFLLSRQCVIADDLRDTGESEIAETFLKLTRRTCPAASSDEYPPVLQDAIEDVRSAEYATEYEEITDAQLIGLGQLGCDAIEERSSAYVYELFALMDRCCLLYTSPSPRDQRGSRMPSSA